MSQSVRRLAAVLLVAFFLRVIDLGGASLWLDEAYSVEQAGRSQAVIWRTVYGETHPPLYYSGLSVWLELAGRSETAARLPSAFISLINLSLLYTLGRRLLDRRSAFVAVLLLAVSPLDVWYGREARMYLFVAGSGLLMALGLAGALRGALHGGRDWRPFILFGAALAAGLYLDYTAVPLWVGLTAVWLVAWARGPFDKRPWSPLRTGGRNGTALAGWLVASFAAWALYLPWLPVFGRILQRLNDIFIIGRLRDGLGLPPLTPGHYLLALAAAGAGLGAAAWLLWPMLERPPVRRRLAFPVLLAFLALTLLAPLPHLFSLKRVLVLGWPFVCLFVAWLAVTGLRRTAVWRSVAALSLLASLLMIALVPKDDWRSAVAYIDDRAAPGDVVWMDPEWNHRPYNYYDPAVPPQFGFPGQEVARLTETAVSADDIWLVAEQSHPPPPSQRWLDANWRLVETAAFYRLEVRRYRRP